MSQHSLTKPTPDLVMHWKLLMMLRATNALVLSVRAARSP